MKTWHIGRGCRHCLWRGWRFALMPNGEFDIVPCRGCRSRWSVPWILAVFAAVSLVVAGLAALCGLGL